MLYLLDKDVKTVKWNGIPLHEASSAIVKEETNGDFYITVRYPITDSSIYQLIKEDMLIKAPTPVLGPQLFRIKKPIENDDSLDITAYHITDDVMQRSINPLSVVGQGCAMALSQMVQNAKTDLGTFSFTSDIMDSRTFNTTETGTLYSVLLDGKHSIVGTWEGELVRDNFALFIKRSRGADRGVVITTHKNLKSYQRTKNSQSVVTRIHAKSTFKPEDADEETTITVTVDSPLISNYPYINEKDYENNNAKTVDELRKWAEAKFKHEGIDKISDAIEIEAYELDGQVIHLGDTVNIKSRKHDVDIYKKAIAYEYNALTEKYISITFDDKPGVGGSGVSSGVSNAADVILGVNANTQEVAIERAVRNANQAFDAEFEKRVEEINDGIEQSKAEAERYADQIKTEISQEFDAFEQEYQVTKQSQSQQIADILSKTQSVESLANQAKSDAASALARANQAKTEAIADARAQVAAVSQALNTAKTELQSAIASADQKARDSQASATTLRNDLNLQASKILAQAQAQTALTNRVTTVESLADGTKTTVVELSKTVSKATGDITSVTSRTKTVEDTLSQTRTQYEALTQTVNAQTGQIDSINRKTADLQSGIDGVTERFENLRVGSRNYLRNASFVSDTQYWYRNRDPNLVYNLSHSLESKGKPGLHMYSSPNNAIIGQWKGIGQQFKVQQPANTDYVLSLDLAKDAVGTDARIALHFRRNGEIKQQAWFYVSKSEIQTSYKRFAFKTKSTFDIDEIHVMVYVGYDMIANLYVTDVQLEVGNIASDFQLSDEDLRSEFATYIRTATENSAELVRRIETADGKAVEAKTYAQQTADVIKKRLESLETYKDAEGVRAEQYLSASRTETAKQITAERTAIASNYVAKSTYDENVRGTTLKLDEIKTTADTAKQNLASYQNTVDRKLEELTSSTQTLDGKINTASAKVDTVAGQIRTEISEVEGKIPQNISHRNLATGSSENWSRFINFTKSVNARYQLGTFAYKDYNTGLYPGTRVNLYVLISVDNVVLDSNISNKYIKLQSFRRTNRTDVWDNQPFYNKWSTPLKAGNNYHMINVSDVISNVQAEADTFTLELRVDGAASCDIHHRAMTVTIGDLKPTYWVKPIDDLITDVVAVKTTITQTASGVEQLSTSLATTDSKVTTAEAKIRNLINEVSSKVSQTDYNTLTGRVDDAETAITQNATEISKRLTKTQVDKAITDKGYQTKSQVDSNITGRGYITSSALQPYALSTTVQTLVKETVDSFSRTISETKALIPSELSGNLLLKSNVGWSNVHDKNYVLADKLEKGKTYTLVAKYWHGQGATALTSTVGDGSWNRLTYNPAIDSWMVTFQSKADIPAGHQVYLASHPETALGNATFVTLVKGNIPLSRWEPAYSELATVTSLHNVKDTVDSHTRTIGAVGTTGSILDNVSRVTQTANGLVQEVSGSGGIKSQVSQLNNSWSVQNLNSSGDILSQANLSSAEFLLEAAKIRLKGKTLADEIQAIDGKFKTLFVADGTFAKLNANVIDSQTITADMLKVDQAFFTKFMADDAYLRQLFAKSVFTTQVQAVTLSASQVTSGILKSTNGAMDINLDNARMVFRQDAKIEFQSENNTLFRTRNGTSAFIHFRDDTYNGVYTAVGVNADNTGTQNDYASGRFAGMRILRTNPDRYTGTTIDEVQIIADTVNFRHQYGVANDYLRIKWDGGSRIDLIQFLRAVSSKLGISLQ